jgi:hypothetical protein
LAFFSNQNFSTRTEKIKRALAAAIEVLMSRERSFCLRGRIAKSQSTKEKARFYLPSHFQSSRHSASLAMSWPHSSRCRANAIVAGASNPEESQSRQNQEGYDANLEHESLERPHHELHKGRELPEATEDMLQQDYHELLLKIERLKAAQEQEVAFYRNIISDTSNEMCRRMQELQHQLQQLSIDFNRFTHEYSRVSHEQNQHSQHKFSMCRLIETLLIVSKAVDAGHGLKADRLQESEKDEFEWTSDSEESSPRRAPRVQKKKARANLRSQTMAKYTTLERPT